MVTLNALADMMEASEASLDLLSFGGSVTSISANRITASGIEENVSLGQVLRIAGDKLGEVVRISDCQTVICPFEEDGDCKVGDAVFPDHFTATRPDANWLGRSFDALGRPIDVLPAVDVADAECTSLNPGNRPGVLNRARLNVPLKTGIKVIDIFTPICRGQRLGIFAGSGVGKSTLLSMMSRSDAFDVVVVALVGERSREVREFLEDAIGTEGMKKTVAIIAPSDASAMLRRRAPELALKVCEHFSRNGKNVLLLFDSITRYAHALREISIANGEPPIARGYPSSVFAQLPKLLERAGAHADGGGSVTAIVTVLVDGDDHNDPIADSVRGIIDGHLVLDRWIADQGRYPSVNPLSSISRLSDKAWSAEERQLVMQLKKMISKFEDTKDLRMLGGWKPGTDPELDKAVETVPAIYEALCQYPDAPFSQQAFDDLVASLKKDLQKGGAHEHASS